MANVADIEKAPLALELELEPLRGDDGAETAPSPDAVLLARDDDEVVASSTAPVRRWPGEGGGSAGARPLGFAMLIAAERDIGDGDEVLAVGDACCSSVPLDIERDNIGIACGVVLVSMLPLDIASERDADLVPMIGESVDALRLLAK
jgi:hypothetical protein